VCAANIASGAEICTYEHIRDDRFTLREGYELQVPPGSYYVYATKPSSAGRGYYTDFITCGRGPECQSHGLLAVSVFEGGRATKIDPVDFYGPWIPTATH